MKSLTIGIDYDDTFTADPEYWRLVIAAGIMRGHRFVCVTCRDASQGNADELNSEIPPKVAILMTSKASKRWFAEQHGYRVDIWIDDQPRTVDGGV